MPSRTVLALVAVLLSVAPVAAADAPAATSSAQPSATATATVTGIPLDAPWKATIYAFAREHFQHPAWGWQHSERNYRLAMQFAAGDGLVVDRDVVFAAAMMHDMAAFPPWNTADVESGKTEHGDAAAIDCVPILRDAGFPMMKIAAVRAAESSHMYYSKPTIAEAVVLHDADSVDFLGDIGIARMLSLVGEKKASMTPALATIRTFVREIPPALVTQTAKAAAVARVAEMNAFLDRIAAESAVQ